MGDFVQLTVSNSQNETICMEKKFPKDISISNLKVGLSVCLSVFIQFVSKIGLTVLARSFLLRCLRSESNCADCVWSVCGMDIELAQIKSLAMLMDIVLLFYIFGVSGVCWNKFLMDVVFSSLFRSSRNWK